MSKLKCEEIPTVACLACGEEFDHAAPVHDGVKVSRDGTSLSMCWCCSHIAIFAPEGLRELTPQELAQALSQPDVLKLLALMQHQRRGNSDE